VGSATAYPQAAETDYPPQAGGNSRLAGAYRVELACLCCRDLSCPTPVLIRRYEASMT
jgi:hypothetical protein